MSYIDPRLHRAVQLPELMARDVEIHEFGCQCGGCEPYVPSVPTRLTAADIGKLAIAGAAVGSAIAFAIDAHGAAAALLATVGL